MKPSPIRITVCAVSAPAIRLIQEYRENYMQNPDLPPVRWQIFSAMRKYMDEEEMHVLTEAITNADLAVIDLMGAPEYLCDVVQEALAACKGQRVVIGNHCRELLRLGRFSMERMAGRRKSGRSETTDKPSDEIRGETGKKQPVKVMRMMRRFSQMFGTIIPAGMPADMKNVFRLIDYWQQADQEDIDSFMNLLLREYFGLKQLPKPVRCTMRYGVLLKDPSDDSLTDRPHIYAAKTGFRKDRATVALLSYGHRYPNDFTPAAKTLYRELSGAFNVWNIVFTQNEEKDLDRLELFLSQKDYPAEAIVNIMPFRLGAGPMGGNTKRAVSILKKTNAPYFKPFCMTRTGLKNWLERTPQDPGEYLVNIILPELDSGILTIPVGVSETTEGTSEIIPLAERIRSTADRVEKYISLRHRKNSEKKIAFICYNDPPGEDHVFGGAFLDTAASLSVILKALKNEGYNTDTLSAEEILECFLAEGRINAPKWSDPGIPEVVVTTNDGDFGICAKTTGNILIALQPLRSEEMNDTVIHDRNTPPPAAYQAFYRWLRDDYQADAVVHVGTHGTLEFLPGRESAMSGDCYPDLLIGDIPHFYLYYMGNPSEAMIARRRAHAVLISYQPPDFKQSGLYGQYAVLKNVIDEYRESRMSAPEKCEDLYTEIISLASALGLPTEGEASGGVLEQLEEELYRFEQSLIPDGLHVFGSAESGESREIEGLIAALNGQYIPVGTAGDVMKTKEVFPSGRNLVQFDPRAIPTKTAFERGRKSAKLLLERYKKEHGSWPKTTAVILWGLETSRSQGETIGQIMEYLGIRLKKQAGAFDGRFEIIPAEELAHPRIDVVIQICGFFRDMFPNILEDLNVMLRKLDERGETDEVSSFAENTTRLKEYLEAGGLSKDEAAEAARGRIFGPASGEYATSLTATVRAGTWKEERLLGDLFSDELSCLYTEHQQISHRKNLLKEQYRKVEMISQIRSMVDYELSDLDHYYEFYGGLSKAVENVKGEKPDLYIADTAGDEVRAESLEVSLERGIGTRLLNPAWIDGMMKHGYHGVQQIEKRFENTLGFAAFTGAVKSDTFSRMEKTFVSDRKRMEQLKAANRWAFLGMLERLMEAYNRGYWDASGEELSEVRSAYLETEGETE